MQKEVAVSEPATRKEEVEPDSKSKSGVRAPTFNH